MATSGGRSNQCAAYFVLEGFGEERPQHWHRCSFGNLSAVPLRDTGQVHMAHSNTTPLRSGPYNRLPPATLSE